MEDALIAMNILENLGFKPLVEVLTKKHKFDTPQFSVVLEEVTALGVFLEVEAKKLMGTVEKTRQHIRTFLDSTGLKLMPESEMGKPEMLLRKKRSRD